MKTTTIRLNQVQNNFLKEEDNFSDSNELLDDIELSEEYYSYKSVVSKSIEEQWNSLVYSGTVFLLFDKFNRFFDKKLTQEQENKIKKAFEKEIGKTFKSISEFQKFGIKTRMYLRYLSNKAGNYELSKFLGDNKLMFKLTNPFYIRKIEDRVETLISGLDNYTKIKFANELFREIKSKTPKTEILKSLNATGEALKKIRENNIIKSETVAQIEYMRYISAKMNGVWYKTWICTLDERTCNFCRPLNQQTIKISDKFIGGFEFPPVHPTCRCYLQYDYETSFASRFSKSNKPYSFYSSNLEDGVILFGLVNPEYVWTGGTEYKGKDKKLIDYYKKLIVFNIKDIQQVYENLDGNVTWGYYIQSILQEAKNTLTNNGFIQLMYKLLNNKPGRNAKVKI